ncbi:hypothetical protein EI94DRAFT_1706982 [Lactarius quietus]|nr:hypothetical protein EI94DRAFT_1706982 [Lactarius quietus]
MKVSVGKRKCLVNRDRKAKAKDVQQQMISELDIQLAKFDIGALDMEIDTMDPEVEEKIEKIRVSSSRDFIFYLGLQWQVVQTHIMSIENGNMEANRWKNSLEWLYFWWKLVEGIMFNYRQLSPPGLPGFTPAVGTLAAPEGMDVDVPMINEVESGGQQGKGTWWEIAVLVRPWDLGKSTRGKPEEKAKAGKQEGTAKNPKCIGAVHAAAQLNVCTLQHNSMMHAQHTGAAHTASQLRMHTHYIGAACTAAPPFCAYACIQDAHTLHWGSPHCITTQDACALHWGCPHCITTQDARALHWGCPHCITTQCTGAAHTAIPLSALELHALEHHPSMHTVCICMHPGCTCTALGLPMLYHHRPHAQCTGAACTVVPPFHAHSVHMHAFMMHAHCTGAACAAAPLRCASWMHAQGTGAACVIVLLMHRWLPTLQHHSGVYIICMACTEAAQNAAPLLTHMQCTGAAGAAPTAAPLIQDAHMVHRGCVKVPPMHTHDAATKFFPNISHHGQPFVTPTGASGQQTVCASNAN